MGNKKFHISVDGQESGPWTMEDLAKKLSKGEIHATDYIFCESSQDWLLLLEHKEVASFLKKTKPNSKPKVQEDKSVVQEAEEQNSQHAVSSKVFQDSRPSDSKNKGTSNPANGTGFKETLNNPMLTEWHILKGENKFGPFIYTDVIKMLQEKVVFEFDFAWQQGMEKWVRIAEISEFKPEHIKKIQESLMPEIKNIFFRRKHPRVPFSGTVIAHDNDQLWKGKGVEISAGGAGVILGNSLLVPGQTIQIHFKQQGQIPAFNAVCEIVSKKFVDNLKEKNAPIVYGLKFKNLSGSTQKALAHFTAGLGEAS